MNMKYHVFIVLFLSQFFSFSQTFYKGVDLSYVNELEDCGVTYKDASETESDVYEIFENNGANVVRLRLWHNPTWTNYSNLSDVKKSIKRAQDSNMEVLLDFHYSDFWTDPGRNWRPAAWEDIDDDTILGDSLYQYTFNTLEELFEEDLLPELVQIGNETNGNILIKRGSNNIDGSTPNLYPIDWDRQILLFNRALEAVQDFELSSQTELQTVIHIANAESAESWFTEAHRNGLADYDIIGLSYYPQWHEQDVRELGDYIAQFKETFGKEVMIVEVGYPWTSTSSGDQANNVLGGQSKLSTYDAFSPKVQNEFLTELTWLVKENGGMGVIYWEPAWVSSSCQTYWGTGSHWDNATFFDFDNKLHEGVGFLSYDYSEKPNGLKDQQVTFKLNMTGVEEVNDVFVTGDFTGDSWLFIRLAEMDNDRYELTTTIPGRTSGGYIFYKNNEWDNAWREEVPSACASVNSTYRYYLVKNDAEVFDFAWNSCDSEIAIKLPVLSDVYDAVSSEVLAYPNPAHNFVTLRSKDELIGIVCYDLVGAQFPIEKNQSHTYNISHLNAGIYFLEVQTTSGFQKVKFLKK